MPPAYTPSQKSAIAQFVSFTSVKESVAAKVSFDSQLLHQDTLAKGAIISLVTPAAPPFWQEHLADTSHHSNSRHKDGTWNKLSMREGTLHAAVARPKRKLYRPLLVEYGLMGNDGRGQSIKLISEVDDDNDDDEGTNGGSGERNNPCVFRATWEGIIKDYNDLYLSNEDRERIHNNQLRPMLQLWVENAQDPVHWMTFESLPMLFRFALRRPLMPEQALIKRLDDIGVMDYLPATDQSEEPVDHNEVPHVSTVYKERIPKGNARNGPHVTWIHEQLPAEASVARNAKRQAGFVLSSLSEEEQELIEDVANVISLCRSGCYTSEQTMDVLYENFVRYDHDYLKYLQEIESGSTSPQSLAERIYEDTKEAPCIADDDDDDFGDDDKDDEGRIIKEVAKAIGLCRSGSCTPQQTICVLYDLFIGYDYNYSKYLAEITSGSVSPRSLAKRIYKDTGIEATNGVDEVVREKVKKVEHNPGDIFQNENPTSNENKVPKVTVKFRFDIKSRFQNIYQQVLTGCVLPHDALSMFRSAVEKPDISNMGLANLMVEHDIPFGLFLSCDYARADKPISNESEENREMNPQTNTTSDPLTPQDSRRTSKLLDPNSKIASVVRFSEPDTPPEDSCPTGVNEPGATLPTHTSGDDKTELLIQALQKLADPEPYDCLCIDDLSEEAEIPNIFFEETLEISDTHERREECPIVADPATIASISKADSEVERSKFGMCITKDHSSGFADSVGHTSFLSRASFAMRPATYVSEVRVPYLVPGSSVRARIRHETDVGKACDRSNTDLREHDRSDWEGCPQITPGGPPDDYALICEHSSSPECGETTALWGLAMPTRKARKLGKKLGLRSDYVNEYFRSNTSHRDAARKMSKLEERRSIPYLKRKRYSTSPGSRMHKSRKGNEVILFAEDDDDHRSFMEKRLRAPTPMVQVRSQNRCTVCNSCICNCHRLQLCPSETIDTDMVLPSIEPSDSLIEAGVQLSPEKPEFERNCRSLSTYTPLAETLPSESVSFNNIDGLPPSTPCHSLTRCQSHPTAEAHDERQKDNIHEAEHHDTSLARPGEAADHSKTGTQLPTQHTAAFVKQRIEWEQKGSAQRDFVSQVEEVGPKEPASSAQDDGAVILHSEAPRLSLLASTSSVGSTFSSRQRDTTNRSLADKPPIPLYDSSINDFPRKAKRSNSAADTLPEAQSASRNMRNLSISTAFLPLTIGGLSDKTHEPAQVSQVLSFMTQNDIPRPAIVARNCSIVTTIKSLKINDEEISLPISAPSQQRRSDDTNSDPVGSKAEHIEDSSLADLSNFPPSHLLPVSQNASQSTVVGRDCSMQTIVEVVEVDSEGLPFPTSSSSSEPTPSCHASSDSVVSMVEKIEDLSPGNASPITTNPLLPISWKVGPPIPVCPSSPRPAPARLATTAPALPKKIESMNSRNAFSRPVPSSETFPRAKKLEQMTCTLPCSPVSAPLKRNRTESNSSLVRPTARLRISSPIRDSNLHQDYNNAMDIEEHHSTLNPFPSLDGSAPNRNPASIDQGHKHPSRKSRLLAKMDRYLARLARLPDTEVPQILSWTPDNVEAAAWKFRSTTRAFLWSKRQDREQRIQRTANSRCHTRYFQNPAASTGKSGTTSTLNKLFDKYRGMFLLFTPSHHSLLLSISPTTPDDPESPDTIGTAGTIKYLTDLTLSLDEPAVLAVLTDLSAPTMGELIRDGFLAGWRTLGADSLPKQIAVLPHLRAQLSSSPDYFRRVYKHTFLLARTPGQKGVALDAAIEFWRLLFGNAGVEWKGQDGTDWLGLWCGFVEERWKKSVSKDMWDQTGVFALKSLEDGSMAWWSEDGAWPGVLDEFVVFVRERRAGGGEGMDIE
ncbi:Scaffold-type E3 ligase [Xylographa bjoerkii]|nr:Scaffold-type E3 ligase [Xylographa bjoerkii]